MRMSCEELLHLRLHINHIKADVSRDAYFLQSSRSRASRTIWDRKGSVELRSAGGTRSRLQFCMCLKGTIHRNSGS